MSRTNHGSRRARLPHLLKVTLLASVCGSSLSMAGQLDSVPVGRWHEFPSSRMDVVKPSPMPAGEIQGVMVAWSGGIYDTDRERLVVWGGGHQDYAGNEVYAFGPLTSDTPRWERLSNPSIPWAVAVNYAPDGLPVARHTYNYLTYLPAPYNKMMSCTVGARFGDGFGAGSGIVDFYDFTINGFSGQPWSRGPIAQFHGAPGGFCAYNPTTQSVWYQPNGGSTPRLQEYRPATNSWINHQVDVLEDRHPTPAIDTRRNFMVSVGAPFTTNTPYSILLYDLNRPSDRPVRITTSGPKAVENGHFPGFTYDSKNDQFVGWNGGAALYSLKAPANPKTDTWVWSQIQLDAGNTVIPTTVTGLRQKGGEIGTFGRFRYVPSQNGVVLVNGTDENVYFFKLGSGGTSTAPLPTLNFAASPSSVASQGTSTLTWSTTNATSCSASGAWTGAKATSGSEARGPLTANSTFVLTCANSAGDTANRSVTVNVAAATPAPTVDLNANPASVPNGGATTLSWTSSNASSCTASNGWSGAKSVTGSENIAALTQQATYTLTCTGPGGTQADSVTVAVTAPTPAPVVTLTSNSTSVVSGSSVTLNWSATNSSGCTANGAWAGTKAASGSQAVGPLSTSSTFGLTCSGSGGSDTKSVTVTVTAAPTPAPTGGGPLASMTAGRWHQFASSRMDAVAPSPLPPGYLAAVMLAWSGGIYDTDRERLVIWGGGGSDYAGNEVYAFGPLTSDTPRWERLTDPSTPVANNVVRGADGRPVSRHTYNLLTYLPAPHNKMMSCGVGGQYSNGSSIGGVDFYDFTINGKTGQPWSAGPTAPSNAYPHTSYCIYNPSTNSVFYQDNGSNNSSLQEFKLATQTWTKHVQYNPGSEPTAAVDTRRNLIVTTGQYHGVQIYDPANPKSLPVRVATTGPKAVEGGRFPGFVYDPVNDQFVGWNGGSAIYTLKAPADVRTGTWVWSQLALDSGNTVTPTGVAGMRHVGYALGTYGRTRYVPSLHGVVLVNATDENVYFFKLPGGSAPTPPPAPTVNLAASPASVASQGSSTLTWSTSNAASCTASGAWSGAKATAGSEVRGPLSANSTFTLTCANSAGSTANKSVTVSVAPAAAAPTVSLTPSGATSLLSGSTINYTWSSTNATSCTATAVVGANTTVENKPTSGSQTIGPLVSNTSVRLACTGAGGSAEAVSTVTIVPRPTVSLSATPTTITAGSSTAVSWSSTNATACVASGGWSGNKAVSGSESVALNASGALNLTCRNSLAEAQGSVSITVNAPTPPPSGSGTEIAQVSLISQSPAAQSDVPFTFGHAFKVGAVPSGTSLSARLADGSSLPLQVDAKAKHADGSLRHAILSGKMSSLGANSTQLLTLTTGTAASGTAVALSDVLATSYNASVALDVGGIIYRANARTALTGPSVKSWLSGPTVSEWLASAPVKTAAGSTHPHLVAYFHVRAYAGSNRIRTDVVIENNWAFVPGQASFGYTATVSVPGNSDYVKTLTHFGGTRWHKRVWWGSEPRVYAKLDKNYLQDTKAIPKYENLTPSESYLNSVRRSTEPMSNGDHEPNMDATGHQPGIGPLPKWDATYAVSTDVRAFDFMLANADGGTAYSIHVRDENTGLPISIDNYPNTSIAAADASSPRLSRGGLSTWFEGSWASHQPSIGYLPYLVTGDYFYLEEMQFWSAYNLIWQNHVGRSGSKGWWYTGSLRGQAWAYRSLAQAAYITPDTHPYKAYLLDKMDTNLDRDLSLYVTPGGPHKNNLGAMYSYDGNDTYLFHDYFMSWVTQYLVDLGFTKAVAFRDYKVKWPIGLMGTSSSTGYCFQAAAQFKWKAGPAGNSTFYPDFKAVFDNTVPGAAAYTCGTPEMASYLASLTGQSVSGANGMIGDQTSTTYYFANLQPALATAADSGVAGGVQAWQKAHASGIHPDYRNDPTWAVVPRTLP